ncbi:MAG: hypothetical protein ACM3JJ_04630 [Hyphomicrobiales bacterium]
MERCVGSWTTGSAARRFGLAAVLLGAAALAAISVRAAYAEDKQTMPDTTGMGAAMQQMAPMMQQMQQMQEQMPDAQLKKLEVRIGDDWKPAELSRAELKTGVGIGTMAKAMIGLGRPKSWLIVQGEASTLVLKDSKPRFRYKGTKKDATSFRLGAFEAADGARHAQVDPAKQADIFKHAIALEMTKVGDDLWELTPKKSLDPGQYGVVNSMGGSVVDFAIGGGK